MVIVELRLELAAAVFALVGATAMMLHLPAEEILKVAAYFEELASRA